MSTDGLTLEQYAEMKALGLDFLHSIDVSEKKYLGAPSVRMRYVDEDGRELAVRYRIAATGDRFRWKSGSKTALYGLNRLRQAREAGIVVLVEGESDCHVLWQAGIPAVGCPGADTWKEERDAGRLDGIPRILLVLEPDQGGETVTTKIERSRIRDRVQVLDLDGADDISDFYLREPETFRQRLATATAKAVPFADYHARLSRQRTETARAESWEACCELATRPRILDELRHELDRSGFANEARNCAILYLALTSRLFERPISVALKGTSSAGKSHLANTVLRFFPASAWMDLTSMSERALIYEQESFEHRFLFISEATGLEGDFIAYLIRILLSEGRLIHHVVEVEPPPIHTVRVEKEGPTGVLTTTTRAALHPETETRMLSLSMHDTPEQTARIIAARLAGDERSPIDYTAWHALQTWLAAGDCQVAIPYGRALARLIRPVAVRLRRDVSTLASLIEAHALLHAATRERDRKGRIRANLDDYAAVHGLVSDLLAEGAGESISPEIAAAVEAVPLEPDATKGVSYAHVGRELGIDKDAARYRVNKGISAGLIENRAEKGRAAKLARIPDVEMPMGEILPSTADLEAAISQT